jgi:hypothetical protein
MQQVVLFLTNEDFANAAYGFMMSLRTTGVIAEGIKYAPHAFNYPEQLKIREHAAELVGAINSASHIVYCQSTALCSDAWPRNARAKKIFLFVGDQGYRNNWEKVLGRYPRLDKVFYQGSDLKGKSNYPEAWLLPAVDTDLVKTKQDVSHMSHNSPIKIAHFPRSPKAKGTKHILAVIDKLKADPTIKDKFVFLHEADWRCDWLQNIERLDTCDIYIESQAYTIGEGGIEERPLGEWGVTCLEACALSKIVVTCFASFEEYKEDYGCISEIVPSGSEDELDRRIRELLALPREEIINTRIATRAWVTSNHNYNATGKRIASLLDIKI